MNKQSCVYLLASRRNVTLYVGVTSDLIRRVHREGLVEGFTKHHGVHDLVWYEVHERMVSAISREKHLKKWSRLAKIRLIEKINPSWRDLWPRTGVSLPGTWIPAIHAGMTEGKRGKGKDHHERIHARR